MKDKGKNPAEAFLAIPEKPTGNEKKLQRIMRYLPGEVVVYSWDGKELIPLYVSDSYARSHASTKVKEGAAGMPDFSRIHPDDVANYQQAVIKALTTTRALSYVYRSWSDEANRYLWKKLNAVSEIPKDDGISYVYAVYTDITEEMDAKLEAEKNHETLKASIAASGQFCFELDPTTDFMFCPPEQAKVFGLPADYIDFPESLFAAGGILEEARPVANALMERLHSGVPETSCEVRMYTKGAYLWYRFNFRSWFDPSKGYPIYLCSFFNINAQKVAEEKYSLQMEVFAKRSSDAIAFSKVNVTKNLCYPIQSRSELIADIQKQAEGKLDRAFANGAQYIADAELRERYLSTFALPSLLENYKNGVMHVALQLRTVDAKNTTKWVECVADLIENPTSLDIEGYIIIRDINASKMEEMLLQRVIERDYHALIYFDRHQDEYMLFDNTTKQYFVKHEHPYTDGVELVLSCASEAEKRRLRKLLTKGIILKKLQGKTEYVLFYEGADNHSRYELSLSNVENDASLVICILREVTDEKLITKLTYEAEHDQLTGLYNRKTAFEKCNKMLQEHPNEDFYMIHFDIQRFRMYNSFFGEAEGDRLLKYVASYVQRGVSSCPYGVFGRIEADQFVICVPYNGAEALEEQKDVVHKALLSFREDFPLFGCSGAYIIKDRSKSAEECYSRAALAARTNTNKRKDTVKIFDDSMERRLSRGQEIVKDMKTALEQEQFVVYLQPKYILFTGEPCGAEALVRWQHPEHGLIFPDDFIPLFESNGFITDLDKYMWEHTCQLLHKWLVEGRKVAPISVNMSRVSMYNKQTVPFLINLVKKYEVPVELLNLELTESAYMDNPVEMKERLEELREAGFEIMMDDFGSAYSSLNTLREIPVDYIKVDRGFLSSVDRDKRSRLVLASVIHMANRMGIPVITEGVETDEQRDFLISVGCDYVQGYLYAKPMPVEQYEKDILEKNSKILPTRKDQAALISKITMNMDTEVQFFADLLPYALAFVELVAGDITYLSANRAFQTSFGMHKDVEDMIELVENHTTMKNYELLRDMYRKIANTHRPEECVISWTNDTNEVKYYLVRAQYLGNRAHSTVMIATFIDLTEAHNKATSIAQITQTLLLEKEVYSFKEIDSYVHLLNRSVDEARIVKPQTLQVVTIDAKDKPVCMPEHCYSFWGRNKCCDNCTTLKCTQEQENKFKLEKKDGEFYLVNSHPVKFETAAGDITEEYAIETIIRLTNDLMEELRESEKLLQDERIKQLQDLLYEDALTTVYNRRYFSEMLYLKEPEPGFKKGEGLAFVLIDLHNFKSVNDVYGYSVGDQLLIRIAAILRNRVRENDSVIRYGGNEFLVVYNNTTEAYVQQSIKNIAPLLAEVRYAENQVVELEATVGYSFREHFGGGISEAQLMINEADENMRAAEQVGSIRKRYD